MKAVSIKSPGQVGLIEIPEPGQPGAGEVLLKIRQVGFCGSDLTSFRGLNPLVSYPRIPGHEIAATIERAGAGVDPKWLPGQNVLVSPYSNCGRCSACRAGRPNTCRNNATLGVQRDGLLTEYAVIPQEKLMDGEGLGLAELALVEPLTVGFHAVARGEVTASDMVVVFGCGAIGLGAIAGAAARGARVVAVDLDDQKLGLARKCGAADVVNSATADLHEFLQSITGGEGPDVMIEAVGLPATFRACVEEVCFGGRVVYIGYAKAPVEYDTKFFVMKELDVLGSRNALPGDFEAVIGHLRSGVFPVDDVVTRTATLAEAPTALKQWSGNPQPITKIHVRIN